MINKYLHYSVTTDYIRLRTAAVNFWIFGEQSIGGSGYLIPLMAIDENMYSHYQKDLQVRGRSRSPFSLKSPPSHRWWRTACAGWWPRCHSWTSRSAPTCSAARTRSPTGCTRTRRGSSRSRRWRRPSPSCRRSWGTTGTASKSSSCRWGLMGTRQTQRQQSRQPLWAFASAQVEITGTLWHCDVIFFLQTLDRTQ